MRLAKALELYQNGHYEDAITEAMKSDRSLATREVAERVLGEEALKDVQAYTGSSDKEEADQYALLESAMEKYQAYDQLTLSFIKLFSDLNLTMRPTNRADEETVAIAMDKGREVLDAMAWFAHNGINSSRFIRAMIVSMRKALDPVTGQPPKDICDGSTEHHFSGAVEAVIHVERKELDAYNEDCAKALYNSDLLTDLAKLLF